MVLLAAYEALLFRLTGQVDFCVGAPTAGRVHRDTEGIIGCFINTLPIRANVSGNPTYVELLQRVRRAALDAFAHQALPFGRMVQELRPARSPSYTPLFQVVFDFNSTPPPAPPPWSELSVEPFGAPLSTAKTDLIVDLWRGADGELLGALEYDRTLFESAEIERLAAAFLRVLEAVAANPDRSVNALPLESEADRERRAEAERSRDAVRRERLAAIKGGRRPHVTHSH
jgi:non-ribosomal peptide synthetase component F